MKKHYVYRITNIETSKHYYGVRTCKGSPKEDIGINYFSSSSDKLFKKQQKELPWRFKYKVVRIFNSREEATKFEIRLHNKFNVGVNENFYNRAKQTSTGWDNTGIKHTVESRQKMSDRHWDSKGENNPLFGIGHSEASKQKISIANKGMDRSEWVNNGEHPWLKQNRNSLLMGNEFTSKSSSALMNKRVKEGNHPIHKAMKSGDTGNFHFFTEKHKKQVSERNKKIFTGTVSATNKEGHSMRISKEEFDLQKVGKMEDREYVGIKSNESKRRKIMNKGVN